MAGNTVQKQDAGNSLELVDIKEIRGDVVVVKDNSLRQIVMVGGVNFALKSDTEQTIITQAYQNFLNGIDFPLQIVIHSRKVNIDAYVANLLARKEEETSAILQNQIEEYTEFIKGFVEKNAIMEKTFLVVISFYPIGGNIGSALAGRGGLSLPFFGGAKKKAATTPGNDAAEKNKEAEEKAFKEHAEQLAQRTSQVVSGLMSIGLEAETLNNEQLIELFYNFYNPQTIERKQIPTPEVPH
jgi:type IV secretory pathway VirB4 component